MLARFWPALSVEPEATVFVPLCGKSLDMRHLAALGHPVIGVELAEGAAQAYFDEAGEEPLRDEGTVGPIYRSGRTAIHAGDYFALDADALQEVGVVYDRAALVALPAVMRARYVEHARAVLPRGSGVQVLLLTIAYDQSAVPADDPAGCRLDDQRFRLAEPPETGLNRTEVLVGVGTRVRRIDVQRVERNPLDTERVRFPAALRGCGW